MNNFMIAIVSVIILILLVSVLVLARDNKRLKELNQKPPRDVSVISYDIRYTSIEGGWVMEVIEKSDPPRFIIRQTVSRE